jgi:hypothetical protein
VKKPFPLHHFLFALSPILFLYSYNAAKIPISPSEMLLPAALSLGAALVLWGLLVLALRSARKSALIVSAFLVLFFLYGRAFSLIPRHYILGIGTATLLAMTCIVVVRSRSRFAGLTVFLNVVAAVLVLANLVTGLPALLKSAASTQPRVLVRSAGSADRPDIYFITLDGYGRSDILRSVYDFDNSGFTDWLKLHGFRVADRSRANYATTFQSFASTLNMTYLDTVVQRVGVDNPNLSVLTRMIKDNLVVRFLKERGYSVVSLSSGYTGTGIKDADLNLAPRWSLSEFQNVLISTTALPPILDLVLR